MRRKFTKEFKFEAVKLVTDRDVSVAQAARDLDLAEACYGAGCVKQLMHPLQLSPGMGSSARNWLRSQP